MTPMPPGYQRTERETTLPLPMPNPAYTSWRVDPPGPGWFTENNAAILKALRSSANSAKRAERYRRWSWYASGVLLIGLASIVAPDPGSWRAIAATVLVSFGAGAFWMGREWK